MTLLSKIAASLLIITAAGCARPAKEEAASQDQAGARKIKIGISFDQLRDERWQRERGLIFDEAQSRGAECLFRSADGDAGRQNEQCEILLGYGVDVLMIVPRSATLAARAVQMAHARGVPVVAYDRLIRDCDLDAYITFDSVETGRMQARYLANRRTGRYFLLGGDQEDYNAILLRQGQMEILQPHIDRGEIEVIEEQWTSAWSPQRAAELTRQLLDRVGPRVDAIVASNDGTAGGAIEVLEERGLAGEVMVSGLDAELAACRRILQGSQSMTVYGPLRTLAAGAVELAIGLAQGEAVVTDQTLNNGAVDVPSVLIPPISLDQENLVEVLTRDGFHTREALLTQ